ncbi:MAG: peptidase E [Clostridia bacterium]|nr:peptidase E [Clostridia bacterium]
MDRYLIAIGGGELKTKETLPIDKFIADLAKKRAGERRANALFIGTASHDSMPYYNTFHKTYTGEFGLKTDCVLSVYGEMDDEKIRSKFLKADMIYVGGGDTVYMLDLWRKKGIDKLVLDSYENGVIICGLSAGAICWFEDMYTDSALVDKIGNYDYAKGLGLLPGCASPHFDERREEVFNNPATIVRLPIYGIENLSAIVFKNEKLMGSVSAGKDSYQLVANNGKISENIIKPIDLSVFL